MKPIHGSRTFASPAYPATSMTTVPMSSFQNEVELDHLQWDGDCPINVTVEDWGRVELHPELTHVEVVNSRDQCDDTAVDSIKKNTVAATMAIEMIQKEMATPSLGSRKPWRSFGIVRPDMILRPWVEGTAEIFYRHECLGQNC